jgi:DNA-binding response OmpR family regulator
MLVRAGFNVVEAEDGYEALEKIRQEKPDAIILDVMMPGMDGFAVCDEIINDDQLTDIPIIMLSAKTDIESRRRGLSSGALRYLIKPIAPDELTQHVREILVTTISENVSVKSGTPNQH